VLPVACVVLVLSAASTGVAAPVEVPDVSVPQVSVPAVPLPAPPVSVPAPPVAVPAPPSTPPVGVPVPALPTVSVPATPPPAPTTYATAPRQVVDAGAVVEMTAQGASERLFGSGSAGPGDRASRRGRRTLYGTRYRKPRWLVRGLRGCLDEIPKRSSRLLVLRYGVGEFEPMPAATVARRLDLSRREYGAARGRALRRLAVAARRSGCERGRLTIAVVSPGDAFHGVAASLPGPVTALAAAATPPDATEEAGGEVLGRSKRGDSRESPAPPPAAVPPLDIGSPTSDLPFLLALFGASALFGWLVYRRARRSKEAIEDPSAVTRMRR
jgi:hypothetical protein